MILAPTVQADSLNTAPVASGGYGDLFREVTNNFKEEVAKSLPPSLTSLLAKLNEIRSDCQSDNWNGEGEKKISESIIERMKSVIEMLPRNVSPPTIGPEPSGAISIEWEKSENEWLIIAIESDGKLSYIYKSDEERAKGSKHYENTIPHQLNRWLIQDYNLFK